MKGIYFLSAIECEGTQGFESSVTGAVSHRSLRSPPLPSQPDDQLSVGMFRVRAALMAHAGKLCWPLAATPSRNVGARLALLLNNSSWKSCGARDTALLSFFLMRGFNSIYLARPNPSQMYASVTEEDYRNQLTRRPRACLAYIFPFKLASHPPCFVLNPTAESLSSGLSEQTGKQRTPAISLWPAFTSETFSTSFFLTFSRGIWKCGDWESKRVPHNMPPWQGRLSCLISTLRLGLEWQDQPTPKIREKTLECQVSLSRKCWGLMCQGNGHKISKHWTRSSILLSLFHNHPEQAELVSLFFSPQFPGFLLLENSGSICVFVFALMGLGLWEIC